jgi:hypothetical protein
LERGKTIYPGSREGERKAGKPAESSLLAYQPCCGSGSGIQCLFDPWIRDPEWIFPDPGSRISDPGSQDHILKSFLTIFLVKSSIIL